MYVAVKGGEKASVAGGVIGSGIQASFATGFLIAEDIEDAISTGHEHLVLLPQLVFGDDFFVFPLPFENIHEVGAHPPLLGTFVLQGCE